MDNTADAEIVDVVPKWASTKKYDWDRWKDGKARKFIRGVHFDSTARLFLCAARRHASIRGIGCEGSAQNDNVAFMRFLPAPLRSLEQTRRGEDE